jgi:hypothetical protein
MFLLTLQQVDNAHKIHIKLLVKIFTNLQKKITKILLLTLYITQYYYFFYLIIQNLIYLAFN